MQPRIFTLSCTSLFLGLCLIFVSGTAISQEVSPGCEAAMDKAAGGLSECLLKADAQFAKGGDEGAKEAAQARCGERFDRDSARAMSRFGADQCTPASLVDAIEDRSTSYAARVASEAGGMPTPSFLFVQSGTGGTLTESTLTLTGVSSQTGYFSDRPYREAGQFPTEGFIAAWAEGENSLAEDPPTADFTCTIDGDAVNYVVELTSPSMAGEDLSYSVAAVGDTVLPQTTVTCEADSHLFIDGDVCGSMSKVTAQTLCGLGAIDLWGLAACPCVVQYVNAEELANACANCRALCPDNPQCPGRLNCESQINGGCNGEPGWPD